MDLPVAQTVMNLPAMQETRDQSLGWEVPLEKGMAIHSSILGWRIPWTEKPGGLQSVGSQRVRHGWATNTHTDAFLDPTCCPNDPMDVGNLISCSSAFSKFSLNIYICIHTQMYLCISIHKSGEYLTTINMWNLEQCGWTLGYYAKWSKSDGERQILYDILANDCESSWLCEW